MGGKASYSMDNLGCVDRYMEEHEAGKDAASQKRAFISAVRVNMQKEIGASGGPGFSADTVLDAVASLCSDWKATSVGIGAFNSLLGGQTTLG